MKTHTMNLSIIKGVIKQDVSKGITLSTSKGDVRPNLRFNNLKISPLIHLLFKNHKDTNDDKNNRIFSASYEQKNHIVIDDISLVLTEKQEIMFDDPAEKDAKNNLLYLIIVEQDKYDIQPVVKREVTKLIANSREKDADNAVVKRYLFKLKSETLLEIATGPSKINNIGYYWDGKHVFHGTYHMLEKMIREKKSVRSYL